ncbi:MAG: hypothetical protein DRP42_03775, partial [Tenericutes bacterium]
KDDYKKTSLVLTDNFMAEQVYDNGKNYFCVYNFADGKISYEEEVTDGENIYVPIMDEEVEKGAVQLPSKAEEYGSDMELDAEILNFIHKWLDVPKQVEHFGLWNIKRSWVFERFHTLNYLRALGDTGQGKSIIGDAKSLCVCGRNMRNMKLKEIYEEFKKQKQGIKVQALNCKTGKLEWSTLTNVFKHPANNLIKIKTYAGRSLIATKDHSFLRYKNQNIEVCNGSELEVGDFVPIAQYKNTKLIDEIQLPKIKGQSTKNNGAKIKLNWDSGFLIGMILAEANIHKLRVDISVHNPILVEKLKEVCERLGLSYNYRRNVFSLGMTLKNFLANKMLNEVERWGKGGKSRAKKIPDFCFFAPEEFKIGLLSGYISGDGTINEDSTLIMYTMSSYLAHDLMELIGHTDFTGKLREKKVEYKGEKGVCYLIFLYGEYSKLKLPIKNPQKRYMQEYLDKVPFVDQLYARLKEQGFNKRIGVFIKEKRDLMANIRVLINRRRGIGRECFRKYIRRAEKLGAKLNELKSKISSYDIKWDRIAKIENYDKEEVVYDLEVKGNHTFVANNICVHNTRFLDTLGSLHYKPILTSGATTSAPVFRIISKWKGTMLFDEADFKQTDETEQIVKILNLGYERGKFVMRCNQNDAETIHFFDPFCPKIIATRKTFLDKAVESRCFTHVLKGTHRRDIPRNLTPEFYEEALKIRNKLLMWRFRNYKNIKPVAELGDEWEELEPRVEQIVTSFIGLFQHDKEQMEMFKKFVQEHQRDIIEQRQSSFDGAIVLAIHSLLSKGQFDINATDIIHEAELKNKSGGYISPRSITSNLKSLGFKTSIPKRVGGQTKRCIPLEQEHLDTLFERYGVTVVTVVTGTEQFLKKKEKNTKLHTPPCVRYVRNDRNTVTPDFDDFCKAVRLLDKGDGADLVALLKHLNCDPDVFEKYVEHLKATGEIAEIKPGFIKLI